MGFWRIQDKKEKIGTKFSIGEDVWVVKKVEYKLSLNDQLTNYYIKKYNDKLPEDYQKISLNKPKYKWWHYFKKE